MSSDSSDDENLEFLKEAQDSQFINDSMFSDNHEKLSKETVNTKDQVIYSLRKSKDEDEQFNLFNVTPEFRHYVAKKLSSILEEKLQQSLQYVVENETPRKKQKNGVKLFSDSLHFIKVTKNYPQEEHSSSVVHHINKKKVNRYSKFQIQITEEAFKEVVVSPEDILSKKEVQNWSNRSKAEVFQYKKSKNGQLELLEKQFN